MIRLFNGIIFCLIVCCTSFNRHIIQLDEESDFEPELGSRQITEGAGGKDGFSNVTATERSLNPTQSKSCFPNDVCFGNETTSGVEHRYLRNCMCDERCIQYRDCCNTSVYYKKEEQTYLEQLPYTCLSFSGVGSSFSVFMKTSCSPSWKETETSKKCDLAKEYLLEHISNLDVTTPVTSYSTKTTYGNAYCALCNFDDNFRYWNVTVGCDEYSIPPPFLQNKSEYLNNYYSSNSQFPEGCTLCLNIMDNISLDYCENRNTMVSSCPTDWSDRETMELCNNFYSSVTGRRTDYRNKYCAYCNGIPYDEIGCYYKLPLDSPPRKSFTILFDFQKVKNKEVCSENSSQSDTTTLKVKKNFCPQIENGTVIPSSENADNDWFFAWYTEVALLLSIFFLILYLIVFGAVKEMQTFGGKNLASFSVALILAYGSFLIGNFAEGTFCMVIGILIYYFFLVAFVCMLTMSYDLWRTFWNTMRKLRLSERQNARFVAYSLWNWLIPVAPVSFALYAEFSTTLSEYSPRFGHSDCWFNNNASLLFFFALPVFSMILVNIAFFAHALYLIQTNRCRSASKKSRVDFKLYARLALLTGLTWATGFIGGHVQSDWLWAVFVFLNTGQGIFIFAAFACKRRTMALFLGRMGFSRKLTSRLEKATTAQSSSEANAMSNLTNVSNATSVE